MESQYISIAIGFLFSITFIPLASAQVLIPPEEYIGYFDSEGVYTVGGNVKNENSFGIIPTITVSVNDDGKTISKDIHHVPIGPGEQIPFKTKFFEVTGKNPILMPAHISYEKITKDPTPIQILYDKTLVKHKDGHVTGRFQNIGNSTINFPKIYAIVHGSEKVLDIVQNIEFIEKIDPGEILNFSMYPDPSVTEDVAYYSCFAPVDTTVVPITTKKNGGDFDFRYDSGAWYSAAKFDEEGTTLSIRGYNSYPLDTYANFEFPSISGNETFNVTFNDEPMDFIQSKDEMGNWHVAFLVGPISQGIVKISGFEKGLPPDTRIPDWIKVNANWWATDQITDQEFLENIDFLLEKGVISVPSKEFTAKVNWKIPSWYKTTANWWFEDKITDTEFLNSIENLVSRDIILI